MVLIVVQAIDTLPKLYHKLCSCNPQHPPIRISALYLILNGTKEEHLNMLEGGIIAKLLDEKWSTFAKVEPIYKFAKVKTLCHFHIWQG